MMVAEQNKTRENCTINEEQAQVAKPSHNTTKDSSGAPVPAPREERLQPIGASDPKNYNDESGGGDGNKSHHGE